MKTEAPALLAFEDEADLAARLAAELRCGHALVGTHRFPDGETRLRLPPALPSRVVLLRGLQQPNDKLLPLLLAAAGARELGAERLTLVCPYLGYMRQDAAFTPGEVVSQRHVGRLLSGAFDAVVTVDPHLHRVATLDAVVPGTCCRVESAAPLLGALAAQRAPGALLLAPDEEGGQWARAAAAAHGLDSAVCHKDRHGDRDVAVALPAVDVGGRAVVLVDDVASTGSTLVDAARGCLARGAASVDVAVTHGLFVDDAVERLRAVGVRWIWSSDTVSHPTNAVSVVGLLAQAVQSCG